jgi:endonuclease YncB( thermonuclease family)
MRIPLLVVVLAMAWLAAACADARVSDRPKAPLASPVVASERPVTTLERRSDGWYLTDPEHFPTVVVDRIIDGDTLDVRSGVTTSRVRLFGIDSAEEGERCYERAKARLAALASGEVRLASDARQRDGFGRELRYVFTPAGRSLDAALVDEGLATAWREDGALRGLLIGIEEAARAETRGCLWDE